MNDPALLERLREYAGYFETLTPERLDGLCELFADNARFRDPFNDVHGIAAIRGVLEHMYRVCPAPRFKVLDRALTGHTAFIRWRFMDGRGAGRRLALEVEGVSRVEFGPDGRVLLHVDYWDPSAQLYERLPLLGGVLRFLRRRLSAGSQGRL